MDDGRFHPVRCRHCVGPLSKHMETSSWAVAPFIRDCSYMVGAAVGGGLSAFYGLNLAMPIATRYVKKPYVAPPVIVFSTACAGLAGGAVPALAQLVSSSNRATMPTSSLGRSTAQDDAMHETSSSPL